jgi:GR25 family glycosyltransferase involved in LPS biosynthesis
MPRVGISYRPTQNLFYSGLNQTALLLSELFIQLGFEVCLVDSSNSDVKWWDDYPMCDGITTSNLYQVSDLDLLIDIDGLISPDTRFVVSKKTVIFLRTFLQFAEMDASVYAETPYVPRSMDHVQEIWCWDILNPEKSIPSIQTIFPCPIRRVPFIWSSNVVEAYSKGHEYDEIQSWTVHVAEKNRENTSSSVLPLVAIRELVHKKVLNATYAIHNIDVIKDNRFLKENILDNIESATLPLQMVEKQPFHSWRTNSILFSHSRFTYLRIGLLNALWLGLPLIHNSPVIRSLHPILESTFYVGNEISGVCRAFSAFIANPKAYFAAIPDIREAILSRYGVSAHQAKWKEVVENVLSAKLLESSVPPLPRTSRPAVHPSTPSIKPAVSPAAPKSESPSDKLLVAFSDMWPGFNYDSNFMIDTLRHHLGDSFPVQGSPYDPSVEPHLIICGPYSENWRSIISSAKRVFFTAEHWTVPTDSDFSLYLTSSRDEDNTHFRLPVWMTFIDWYSKSTTLPTNTDDNPIRLPLHFATTPHPVGFSSRKEFCGFVVTNPICTLRNQAFEVVNAYKKVNSGGALYNNIGGPLALKYPGGGCGDISKHEFFSKHQFTISFENAQVPGYITEKVLHAKMAGCVPLYWGDANTDTDFAPNSFLNLSSVTDASVIVNIIKKLETNPTMCAAIASTPILNQEKKNKALALLERMCHRLLSLVPPTLIPPKKCIEGIDKTYVINLDTRPDRWEKLLTAEPYLKEIVERVPGVNGKTLAMNPFIFNLFNKNEFQWKKSIIGCNLSHISVWSKIAVSETGTYFLVLEDDVRFQDGWMEKWKTYLPNIPADADLLYLGGVLPPNKPALPLVSAKYNEYWSFIQPNTLFSPVPVPVFHFCAYSYILTRTGAQKLMSYMFDSEKKSFTVSDHLLGHPDVGLKKYFTNPLLSYCFQEEDPVYLNSQFNDLHREDKFDSDIWNNRECFTEEELEPFRTPVIKSSTEPAAVKENPDEKIVYFYPKEGEKTLEPYEHKWLEEMLQVKLQFRPLEERTELGHHLWYLVQRPHVFQMIHLFQQLEESKIPFKVIHISDEFGSDDISFYGYSMCKAVIRNYLRKDVSVLPSHVLTIPLGYHHQPSTTEQKTFDQRELVWSFHGTDWFERSAQLREFVPFVPYSCHLQPNWNHPTATREKTYLTLMGNSKFCPILRGQNPETFRLYEALESGALPVTTISDTDYLKWIEDNLGLSSLYDWTHPTALLNSNSVTEHMRGLVSERWNAWKERIKTACASLFK